LADRRSRDALARKLPIVSHEYAVFELPYRFSYLAMVHFTGRKIASRYRLDFQALRPGAHNVGACRAARILSCSRTI
jgi:hypothetical protein